MHSACTIVAPYAAQPPDPGECDSPPALAAVGDGPVKVHHHLVVALEGGAVRDGEEGDAGGGARLVQPHLAVGRHLGGWVGGWGGWE